MTCLLVKWRRSTVVLAVLLLLVTTMWIIVGFLSSLLFGAQQQLTNGQLAVRPVKVEVFYETLCPDSIAFILTQLWPTYKLVSSIMDVRMIPFGKAKAHQLSNGSWSFTCQHGPPECYGNLVQTCALAKYGASKALPLIVCMENTTQPEASGPTCASKLGLDYLPIQKCVSSPEGNAEQYKMARKTLALKPHFVPWIGINENVSSALQPDILNDLIKVVCNAYRGKKPSACSTRIGVS